ncbi:MAG TPA: FixH family protein [Candidatus Angelobacter sp.]|jgi:hypothetical protein|nr:FixH family protein [Candidatus Angelobacter sp.]
MKYVIFIVFISFIISIIFLQSNVSPKLGSEHSFEKGIKFQEHIEEKKNAYEKVKIQKSPKGIEIKFPIGFHTINTFGNVFIIFFSKKKDIRLYFKPNFKGLLLIPSEDLNSGVFELHFKWKTKVKKYLIKEILNEPNRKITKRSFRIS